MKTEVSSLQSTSLGQVKILLADSDSSKISQVISQLSDASKEFSSSIRVCKSYFDLAPMLETELPDLLLLGMLEKFNYFVVCDECHTKWSSLPIVLLSRQQHVDDAFYQLASSKGATDIITKDLDKLDLLLQKLSKKNNKDCTLPNINAQTIVAAFGEITEVSKIYFGTLAPGNYWRKAHTHIVNEFPSLQNWSADHFGVVSCNKSILQSKCTNEDLHDLRRWVSVFISECERIIVDFGDILKKSNLSPTALQLLPSAVSSE
jgi:CheY-like chemotaxis protein